MCRKKNSSSSVTLSPRMSSDKTKQREKEKEKETSFPTQNSWLPINEKLEMVYLDNKKKQWNTFLPFDEPPLQKKSREKLRNLVRYSYLSRMTLIQLKIRADSWNLKVVPFFFAGTRTVAHWNIHSNLRVKKMETVDHWNNKKKRHPIKQAQNFLLEHQESELKHQSVDFHGFKRIVRSP